MNYEEARNYIAHIQGNLGSDYSLKEVTRLAEYMDMCEVSDEARDGSSNE